MASYTISVISDAWVGQADKILARLDRIGDAFEELADETVLPILARHYDASGIKHNFPQASIFGGAQGVLRRGITQRGALGNFFDKTAMGFVTGVSYGIIPHAKWVLEGRGPVRAKRGKALHWVDENGREIFVKSVGPAPAHPVYFLTPAELGEVERALAAIIARGK